MGLISYALSGNYKRFWNDLKSISKKNGKNPVVMFFDMGLCFLFLGAGLQDYLGYRFYEKGWKERRTFATIGYMDKVNKILCGIEWSPYISNKLSFHQNYSAFTHRDYFKIEGGVEGLKAFLAQHEEFVVKPQIGLGGSEVKVVKAAEITDPEAFYEQIVHEKLLVEELIVQNEEWAKMSKKSVNTIRVITGAVDGRSRLLYAGCRFGAGDSIADNIHSGGCCAEVDISSGVIATDGFTMALERIEKSPSGVRIKGTKVPYFEEIKTMCLKAALVNDQIHLVGWDVAIAKDGPCLIEGNRGPGFDLVQIPSQKGAKWMLDELVKEVQKTKKK